MFCIYFTITAQAAYSPISEHVSLPQIEREEADHQCVLTFSCEVRVPPAVQVKLHQESTYGQDINHDNTLQHTCYKYCNSSLLIPTMLYVHS